MKFKQYYDANAKGKGWEVAYIILMCLAAIMSVIMMGIYINGGFAILSALELLRILFLVFAFILFINLYDWRIIIIEMSIALIINVVMIFYGVSGIIDSLISFLVFASFRVWILFRLIKLKKQYFSLGCRDLINFAYDFALRMSCTKNFFTLSDKTEDDLFVISAKSFFPDITEDKINKIFERVNAGIIGTDVYGKELNTQNRGFLFVTNLWIATSSKNNLYRDICAIDNSLGAIANSYYNGEISTDPIQREKHCEAITDALNPINRAIANNQKKRKAVTIAWISVVSVASILVLVYFSLYGVAYSKYREATVVAQAYGCDLYLPASNNFLDLINEFNNEIAPNLKRDGTNSVTLEEWKVAETFLENLKNKSAPVNKDVETYATIVHNQVRCARICKQMFYWFS